ncbi:MAG: selenocysteine-specific translation elongation factor [Desulfobulbaceae bacterium]|nr:selenocysteine-specific translation elongation factor [Desulfobulbaceae bacterium]HIJ78738.1 selenocysteine-specific translation elongation factor [Deltaproteobacteria bacterium]
MREIVLGTAGHVDHGKTSLVRALTGIETDRLKEEKKRGITIELGFAYLDLPCGHRLGIIDVPGHERFVKNMVAGVAGIDLVAFVIAADEGIMPQTREHFEICQLLGVERGLIVLTKKDMVDQEWLELVQEDVRGYFKGSFLEDAPLAVVSSTTGEGIDQVREILDQMVGKSEFSEAYGPFRLPVDRIFSMKGFGAVVTGTSISGRIGLGEDITVYPQGLTAKVRGIQIHGEDAPLVEAGNRTAINVQGLEKDNICRGNVLATPGSLHPSYMFDADFLYLSSNSKPLKNRARVRVHFGTAEIMGRVVLLEDEELRPGLQANVQLLLEEPGVAWPGDRYVVRSYSPVYTIGGGAILNNAPPKRRRFKEDNNRIFEIYHQGSPEDQALLHLREAGVAGLTLDELSVKTGRFGKRFKKVLEGPISSRRIIVVESDRQRMIAEETLSLLVEKMLVILGDFHQDNPMKPGLSKEELRSRLHRNLDQKLFQLVVNDQAKKQQIALDESVVRLASHKVSLQEDAQAVRREMEDFYRQAGLVAPTLKEVQANFGKYSPTLVREVLELLVREQVLVKINEDLYFYGAALSGLQESIVDFITREGDIDAPRFKELTGLTRKFSIPLLEYFDKIKVTIRVGDKRILRERSSR